MLSQAQTKTVQPASEPQRLTQVGVTAEGWIMCETEEGSIRLMEPSTREVIDLTA